MSGELDSFIARERKKGTNDSVIEAKLISVGWPKNIVKKSIAAAPAVKNEIKGKKPHKKKESKKHDERVDNIKKDTEKKSYDCLYRKYRHRKHFYSTKMQDDEKFKNLPSNEAVEELRKENENLQLMILDIKSEVESKSGSNNGPSPDVTKLVSELKELKYQQKQQDSLLDSLMKKSPKTHELLALLKSRNERRDEEEDDEPEVIRRVKRRHHNRPREEIVYEDTYDDYSNQNPPPPQRVIHEYQQAPPVQVQAVQQQQGPSAVSRVVESAPPPTSAVQGTKPSAQQPIVVNVQAPAPVQPVQPVQQPATAGNITISTDNVTVAPKNMEVKAPVIKATETARPKEAEKLKDIKAEMVANKLELLEERFKNLMGSGSSNQQFEYKNPLMTEELELVHEPVGDRAETGIEGLDPVIEGGLKRNTITMVAGGPGSGKSTLGLQFLYNGVVNHEENGIYITFEQQKERVIETGSMYGWKIQELIDQKKLLVLEYSPEQIDKMLKSGGGSFRDLIESIGAVRVVVDSITAFMLLYEGEIAQRRSCLEFFHNLSKWGCTSVVIVEEEYSTGSHSSSVLEYETDGVVILYNERRGDIRQRALEIFKMRDTKHAGRIFPMKLTSEGLVVYPQSV